MPPDPAFKVHRTASLGSKQYGFTSVGRGFNWLAKEEEERNRVRQQQSRSRSRQRPPDNDEAATHGSILGGPVTREPEPRRWQSDSNIPVLLPAILTSPSNPASSTATLTLNKTPALTPPRSPSSSRVPSPGISRSSGPRTPTSPRPPTRRRSSQKRVSLVAGRLHVIDNAPEIAGDGLIPTPYPLARYNSSQSSLVSFVSSTRAPSPVSDQDQASYLGSHSISDYVIDGEAGRGAYGLVKRAREKLADGTLGPSLIIKQVIKSRILADCWKKHPKLGTIPVEIYVMSSTSNTSYVLPPKRAWDPSRPGIPFNGPVSSDWVEGAVVKGHPSICPLLDFFEDAHFYYLVMPSTCAPPGPHGEELPSDLFDLVELYPQGLPPHLIRSYLGQMADGLCFLHSKGIVHRDIKDENVVLGPTDGKCILIDFGSSGIVRRGGWDTFSGTLDYAGPEILRGESYNGKEQDVWAFGVVAFVLLVGECPFMTPTEAQEGLTSPFSKARMALDERCQEGHEDEGKEPDGGGRLDDAHHLVMACLQVDVNKRPTFEKILTSRFLIGREGW